MGTNYYFHPKPTTSCPTCGHTRTAEPIHIGKSSVGWTFGLHVRPRYWIGGPIPQDLDAWRERFLEEGSKIQDEYGQVITVVDMLRIITDRSHPNGLRRRPLDEYCIGHGEGTWDLVVGDFS